MKKTFKIIGIVIGVILIAMVILPFAFKGKIKEVIVAQGNKQLDARFDFNRLGVSFFRSFPSLTATLNDFYIVGVDRFEGDTLVRADMVSVTFNLASLLGDGGYEVNRVAVQGASLNAIVLEDGKANWDIMKPSTEGETQTADTTASPMNIKLNSLTIKDLTLTYDDREGKMYASVADLAARMSGDLSASHSIIKLKAEAEGVDFRMDNVPYLKGARFDADMDVDADLDSMKFTLKENLFHLNAIEANLDGWLAMLTDGMDMDLKFSTPKINFKDILSLIPAIYAKDFESVKATGEVSLGGWVKGQMVGDTLPAFDVDIKVADATFRYPSLPRGVEAINIAAQVKNPGGSADLTTINVNPFSFNMGGNPFSVVAAISTPVSDAAFDASANGVIDLGMVKEVYPLEGMELSGVVKAGVSVAGRMSYIEKEQYELVKASGTIALTDMLFKSEGNPDVNIKKSTLTFSPKYLDLSETNLVIGSNDLTIDSRIENYIAYALHDKELRGRLNLRSKHLNVSELMGDDDPAAASTAADTSAISVIEVPRNLDLAITAAVDRVLYDNITLDNVKGDIVVCGGKAEMKNLTMNTMGGSVKMNGTYSTAKSVEQPELAASFAMQGLSFTETFKSFTTIQKLVPVFENLDGNFSGSMDINTLLSSEMSPVLNSMNGRGSLSTQDLGLSKVGVVSQILELTKLAGVTDKKVKDMKVDFTIDNGRVRTNPFDIKMGDAAINLSGTTGLDQSIDYTGKVQLPPAISAVTRMSSVNLLIGGSFTSPKVSVDMKGAATQVVQSFVGDALGSAGEKLGVNIADAQKQKEALVDAATKAGDQVMQQAQQQADALVEKANDPISKLAARTAANKLLKQAQVQVDKSVAAATAKGDSIISKAQPAN